MDRPFSRITTLIGSAAAIGLLLAGCATTTPIAAVIGVPRTSTSVTPQPSGNFLTGLQEAITGELAAVSATQSGTDGLSQLNELNSISSFSQYEQIRALLAIGANEAAKRERIVQALVADVQNDAYLNGVTVGGRSLSGMLISMLNGVNSQLQSLASTIAATSLTDLLRGDILSINASTRVYGLVEPQVHLVLAAGDELSEVQSLIGQETTLQGQVAAGAATDPRYSDEQTLLHDLAAQIATATRTADTAVTSVLKLTASGFPANRATIVSARTQLAQLRAPLGTLAVASGDIEQIQSLLALR